MSTIRQVPLRRLLPATVMSAVLVLTAGGSAGAASAASASAAPTSRAVVAQNDQGVLKSRVVGETAQGWRVTGSFVPLDVRKLGQAVKVRGLLTTVVHKPGPNVRTAVVRTLRVASVNRVPATSAARTTQAGATRATCDVLHLVLGPLDLDLLGLEIHLNRVVLDIVARTGAGNLLGNLLCAITGLLDGGLGGQLGRLTRLLDRVLDSLGLGV